MEVTKEKGREVPENYHKLRRHIKHLISKSDVSLAEWVRESGRPKRSQYQYVWQVLDGREGKISTNVLSDLRHVLKYYDQWEDMKDVEIEDVEEE